MGRIRVDGAGGGNILARTHEHSSPRTVTYKPMILNCLSSSVYTAVRHGLEIHETPYTDHPQPIERLICTSFEC